MATGGLEGVVAASTRLSHVDGEAGERGIAGYRIDELAANPAFEETTWLLWHGRLPSATELTASRDALARARDLPDVTITVLTECARRELDPMDALRMAADTLSIATAPLSGDAGDDGAGIVARMPVIVAA